MASPPGGMGDASPPLSKSGGDVPPTFRGRKLPVCRKKIHGKRIVQFANSVLKLPLIVKRTENVLKRFIALNNVVKLKLSRAFGATRIISQTQLPQYA